MKKGESFFGGKRKGVPEGDGGGKFLRVEILELWGRRLLEW